MRFDRRDKRFQLFSDEPSVDAEYYETEFSDFLGRVRRVIREAHEGLISAAEVFYRQKVMRKGSQLLITTVYCWYLLASSRREVPFVFFPA